MTTSKITAAVTSDPTLSLNLRGAYATLAALADEHGSFRASLATMAAALGVTRRTASRIVGDLEKAGLLEVQAHRGAESGYQLLHKS